MMSGQDPSPAAAAARVLASSASTGVPDPLIAEPGAVSTPARGPAPQRTPSFRPPLRRLSSSKVHAAFKSPLRTPTTASGTTSLTNTTTTNATLTPLSSSSSEKCSTTGRESLKTTPTSRNLTSSARHKPYSLTPARSRSTLSNTARVPETEERLRADIGRLKEQMRANEAEIEELSQEYSEDQLQQYIDHLHEYNEIKDAGQLLLGKLAEVRGTTVSELYRQFDLSLDD